MLSSVSRWTFSKLTAKHFQKLLFHILSRWKTHGWFYSDRRGPRWTKWRTLGAITLPGWYKQPPGVADGYKICEHNGMAQRHGTRLLEDLTADTKTIDATSTRTSTPEEEGVFLHQHTRWFNLLLSTLPKFAVEKKAQAGWPQALSMSPLHMAVDNTHTSENNKHLESEEQESMA